MVGRQIASESMDTHSTSGPSGAKDSQPSSSQPRVPSLHSSGPGPGSSAAGGSGQDPNKPKQDVSHLAILISNEDEFTDDPHQIIPIQDAFALPYVLRQGLKGLNCGYILLAEISGFQGTCYHESGDMKPGYTGASPWDHPLDHQGHVASKLHSGMTAYSSYIGLISTGIVYPQQGDPNVKIDQYNYFNIFGSVPPPNHYSIWGCLHYLPLVLNMFLA